MITALALAGALLLAFLTVLAWRDHQDAKSEAAMWDDIMDRARRGEYDQPEGR